MKKINLLYIITKLEFGGAQKQLLLLARHLDERRYNLFLLTAKVGLLIDEAVSIKGLKLKTFKALERSINPIRDLLAVFEIYFFIKRNNIDIVHTHSSKAGILGRWAAKFSGAKVIIHTVHGWSFNDCQNAILRKIFIILERLTAKITDRLIVVSHADKQKGIRNRIGEQKKYILVRYGINPDEFISNIEERQKARKGLGLVDGELLVGMISCFKPQKAPQDFIKLAALVNKIYPQIKFLLIGDGILRKKIEKTIKKFNLNGCIILTGWRRDIPELLSAIDIFVLTSLWEGLPIAVLEAMASGKPVIATDTGGVSEIIKSGINGYLVERRDIKAIRDKIIALLKDQDLKIKMGENAREILNSDFRSESAVFKTQNLYEDLIKDKE
jgi:glycosyltransferase involved in cell wall biosynthesis